VSRFLETFSLGRCSDAHISPHPQGMAVTIRDRVLVRDRRILLGLALAFGAAPACVPSIALIVVLSSTSFRALPRCPHPPCVFRACPIFWSQRALGSRCLWLVLSLVLRRFAENLLGRHPSIPKGQLGGRRARTVSFTLTLAHGVWPQAVRPGILLLTNRTIAITKNAALRSRDRVSKSSTRPLGRAVVAPQRDSSDDGGDRLSVLFVRGRVRRFLLRRASPCEGLNACALRACLHSRDPRSARAHPRGPRADRP